MQTSTLRGLIQEILYTASAPKRFDLPEVEVDAENTREAGEKAAGEYYSMHGVRGLDPFSIDVRKKATPKMSHSLRRLECYQPETKPVPLSSYDQIDYTVGKNGYGRLKYITLETLERIVPEAVSARGLDSEEDLEIIWFMDSPDQTNEPELTELLADNWDEYAVTVGDKKIVILAGTDDDEYGYYWDNSTKEWYSYMF